MNNHIRGINLVWSSLRGTVIEWLERLGYDAECRRQVVSSRLGFDVRRLEISVSQPSSKWVPFSN